MEGPVDRSDMKQSDETGIEFPGSPVRARHIAYLFALVLFVCILPALAQEPSGKDLRKFYLQNCVSCHGPDGSAVSAEGKNLRGQDLTTPEWQKSTSDDEMVEVIQEGKFFGLGMPSFKGSLTNYEVQRMVTDIIRLSKKGQVIAPNDQTTVEKQN